MFRQEEEEARSKSSFAHCIETRQQHAVLAGNSGGPSPLLVCCLATAIPKTAFFNLALNNSVGVVATTSRARLLSLCIFEAAAAGPVGAEAARRR